MSLSKTVALVTGGSSGLGAAAVQALRRHGAKVLIADLQEPMSLSQQEGQLNSSTLQWSKVDVTDPDSVTAALDHLQDTFGQPLNACIQCAGVATARKMISGKGVVHSLEDFARTIAINTNGTFNVARLAAERMTENAVDDDGLRGCFVHTASIAAYEGQIGQVAYAASKGAIVGMTLPMARDLAPLGIRVMTIAPGLFKTPLLAGLPETVQKELGYTVPCPSRLGDPKEFGQLVVSILENPMLNGSVIRLDGALRMPP
uniref:Ketoreductase domain-containing protein n=1 Tax=Amphora coffeiformis TaxID=265554 RepID=A0A7S3L6T3_9STRA|mmetsp:Transcript_8537/g.16327  ORF Transcript_8537/g.16327 Transcript_8537/m.16327 type:complete len:259 (+) Transcript_8537:112-888(+)